VLYLHRVGARLDEVLEAQIILEEVATRRALERLDDNDAARLQAFAESPFEDLGPDPKALHRFIASLTRNPALELFVEVVGRVVMLYSPDWRQITAQAEKTKRAHAGIAAAALAGNTELAQRRMRWHLGAEADLLRATGSTRQLLPERVMLTSNTGKGAEAVARNITQMIIDAGMEAGELVGAETQLIESEGVSRAILREAVRLLEHHEIARMRRGPGGGLFVVQPSTRAVTDVVALYLARRGMQLSGLAEFRTDVEVAIVSLAVAHIDEEGIRRLQQVSIREEGCSSVERVEDAHDLHAAVAVSAQSRVLELVALVLLRLSSRHGIECLADRAHDRVREEVLRAHRGIVDALTRGDRDVACERMRRHLGAITVRTR
ncbi:MAG: FCD domain-containing protein, partial [Acidimicrobiales bacterium]